MPTSTGGTWQCTFADEFDGQALDRTKWAPQRTEASGFTSGKTACFVDSPDNISVSNGTLKLTARKEAQEFSCKDPWGHFNTRYTSGMVSTWGGRFSQTYGRFEVRAKMPAAKVPGLQTSLWLWPVDDTKYGAWPNSGEIDIAEVYSRYPDRAIPYIHHNNEANDPNKTKTDCLISDIAAFHKYAVEWTASTIKIIYDDQTCLINTWDPASPQQKPQPFDHPFMIALTQALGIAGNDFDPATTPLPATTEIDYVRVWAETSTQASAPVTVPVTPPSGGSGPSGGGGSTGGGSGAAGDSTAPSASVSGEKAQKLGEKVSVEVNCSTETCAATLDGKVRVRGARAAKTYKLKQVSKAIPQDGTRKQKLELKLSKEVRDAARKALTKGEKVTVALTIVAADAVGNRTTKQRTVKLKLR